MLDPETTSEAEISDIIDLSDSDIAPLLVCDHPDCYDRATVVALVGLPQPGGPYGRNWVSACPVHPLSRRHVLIIGITTVVQGG